MFSREPQDTEKLGKKAAVWTRKEAHAAFGDGSVMDGGGVDGWMERSLMHPVGLGKSTMQIPVVRREGR